MVYWLSLMGFYFCNILRVRRELYLTCLRIVTHKQLEQLKFLCSWAPGSLSWEGCRQWVKLVFKATETIPIGVTKTHIRLLIPIKCNKKGSAWRRPENCAPGLHCWFWRPHPISPSEFVCKCPCPGHDRHRISAQYMARPSQLLAMCH